MTHPALRISSASPLTATSDVLVLGVRKTPAGPELQADAPEFQGIAAALGTLGVTGADEELVRLPAVSPDGPSIALIGLGTGIPSESTLRNAAGAAARQLRGIDSLTFALPAASDDEAAAILEGAAIGAYSYTRYLSATLATTKTPANDITMLATVTDADAVLARATAVAEAMTTVRDLVNAPPSHLYPESFADAAQTLAKDLPIELTVLDADDLADGGYGGILGVGQGSTRGPRLVKLTYSPENATRHLALVGKGITFDSGGLSLKPATSMVGMKYDMAGAASVLAVTIAAARLGLPVRITGWLCLAENLPSGNALRPNDVIRIRGGKTVEVLNTDAEGRLVLADGLVAASEERPDAIIDVATLTGAVVSALGDRTTGAMGDADLIADLQDVSTRTGEAFWPLPLPGYLKESLRSDVADLSNGKAGPKPGGALVAGVFLQQFVGSTGDGDDAPRIPWLHLDTAGTADNGSSPRGYLGTGATGTPVLSLLALAERYSRA
ncbi:MAG: leucyl aminopeptidase [Microbacteriaceae bacterium]